MQKDTELASGAILAAIEDNTINEIVGKGPCNIFIKKENSCNQLKIAFASADDYHNFLQQLVIYNSSIDKWHDLEDHGSGVVRMNMQNSLTLVFPPVVQKTSFVIRKKQA